MTRAKQTAANAARARANRTEAENDRLRAALRECRSALVTVREMCAQKCHHADIDRNARFALARAACMRDGQGIETIETVIDV